MSSPPSSPWLRHATRITVAMAIAWAVLCVPLAWLDVQDRWLSDSIGGKVLFKSWLYWAVWAGLPLLLACGLSLIRHWQRDEATPPLQHWNQLLGLFAGMSLLTLGGYAGLVEPRLLRVQTHHLATPPGAPALRLALISDLHLGLFWRCSQLERLVDQLNALTVDAVLVAGDWTYEPERDLAKAFAPFTRLRHPVYGVLGNHDLSAPGADYADTLKTALQSHGVTLIDGAQVMLKGWSLVGVGDLWGDDASRHIELLREPAHGPRIVLTHQPDAAARFPAHSVFLTLAGHTHGGQIRLPLLTQKVLQGSTEQPWYLGWYDLPDNGQLLVTGGLGTIGLPARLGVTPTIEVIELR